MNISSFNNPIQRELRRHFQLASDREILNSLNLQFKCKDRIDNHAIFLGALQQEMQYRGWDFSIIYSLDTKQSDYQLKLIDNRLEIA